MKKDSNTNLTKKAKEVVTVNLKVDRLFWQSEWYLNWFDRMWAAEVEVNFNHKCWCYYDWW